MIPIKPPIKPLDNQQRPESFSFSKAIYTFYEFASHTIVQSDHQDWFLIADFQCDHLNDLKYTRQIRRPDYLKDEHLPAIALLEKLGLQIPNTFRFDKAFGHALYYVEELADLSARLQLKIANYDGLDDPEVSAAIHYVENIYDKEKTHFVAGVETYSFATITENQHFAEQLWREEVGELYLLLFTYYKLYHECPSYQMMPKLLCNLWSSTEAFNNSANPQLYRTQTVLP